MRLLPWNANPSGGISHGSEISNCSKNGLFSVFFGKLPSFFSVSDQSSKKLIKNSNHFFLFVVRSDGQKWNYFIFKNDPKKILNSVRASLVINIGKLKILKEIWLIAGTKSHLKILCNARKLYFITIFLVIFETFCFMHISIDSVRNQIQFVGSTFKIQFMNKITSPCSWWIFGVRPYDPALGK